MEEHDSTPEDKRKAKLYTKLATTCMSENLFYLQTRRTQHTILLTKVHHYPRGPEKKRYFQKELC